MKKKSRTKKFNIFPAKIKKALFGIAVFSILSCFAWITEEITSVNLPQQGEIARLYSNQTQNDLRQTFVTAIQQARHSIVLMIYSLTDRSIIQSLREKAEQGVSVTVICDVQATKNPNEKLGPNIKIVRRSAEGLMHQKILLIDNEQTWIGSANMTGESLRMYGNLVTAFFNPDMAKFVKSKAESLGEYERSALFLHRDFWSDGQKTELWFLPDNRDGSIRIKELIRSAKKTLRIAMFTWTRSDFAKEVIDAQKRGVDVQVVIDRNQGNGSGAMVVEMLKRAHIPLHLSNGAPLLHHKFAYIDGTTLENGSANWTKRAFSMNDDCFIILHDLNEEQRLQMEKLWKIIWLDSSPA